MVKTTKEKWLSIAELARRSEVPESTARRYLTRFESFFRGDERSRGRRYHPDSIVVLVRIQSLYGAGLEAEEIDRILVDEFPMVMNVSLEEVELPPPPVPPFATREDIDKVYSMLESLRTEIKQAREENKHLRLLLEIQSDQEEIKRKMMQLEGQLEQKDKELNEWRMKKPWWKFW